MNAEKSAIATTAEQLATAASTIIAIADGAYDANAALDYACQRMADNATDARTRGGIWAGQSTTQSIDEALFAGSVARDILDGTITRPSVGNVREYALSRVS